jgi:hypothetical protein
VGDPYRPRFRVVRDLGPHQEQDENRYRVETSSTMSEREARQLAAVLEYLAPTFAGRGPKP